MFNIPAPHMPSLYEIIQPHGQKWARDNYKVLGVNRSTLLDEEADFLHKALQLKEGGEIYFLFPDLPGTVRKIIIFNETANGIGYRVEGERQRYYFVKQ